MSRLGLTSCAVLTLSTSTLPGLDPDHSIPDDPQLNYILDSTSCQWSGVVALASVKSPSHTSSTLHIWSTPCDLNPIFGQQTMMMIFYCIFSGYIQKQRGHLICVLGQSFYCYLILSWDQEQTQHRFYAASLFFPPFGTFTGEFKLEPHSSFCVLISIVSQILFGFVLPIAAST